MTRLFNEPRDFARESASGFARAFGAWARPVKGGMVRSAEDAEPTVALVIGGGSGHYPAFAGLVGPGLAHGAVMGDLFASPSASQVESVAMAAQRGRGVLLSYGNYAGDVLNFDDGQRALRAAGIDCETVVVTDDISSAPAHEAHLRRGIAGDLIVFKVAGAAAAEGADLATVAEVARLANDRTRTLGVAFTGCTLPGSDTPLFTVPEGRMAVGMGIHGEPGIDETDVPTADGLAALLVESLLKEVPPGEEPVAPRVVALLSGLGSVKYEELFVVYDSVARRLEDAGVVIAACEVGELVTSFDMAGVSLTLCWLDDELERLWKAPASTAAYRTASVPPPAAAISDRGRAHDEGEASVPPASEPSRTAAAVASTVFDAWAEAFAEAREELGRIDAIAGDGDHGIGMERGSRAAAAAAAEACAAGAGVATAVARAGAAWADAAGGTSGSLWGTGLRACAAEFSDVAAPTPADVARAITAAADAIVAAGGAQAGDKTMVDVLLPMRELAGRDAEGVDGARLVEIADAAAEATAALTPRKGRAHNHVERSLGTKDAGATSLALAVATAVLTLSKEHG